MDEIMPILAEAGMEALPQPESYTRVSVLSIPRRCLAILLPLALLAAGVSLFRPLALLAFGPILLIGLLVALQWRRHRYALTDRALYIHEGILRQRLWILPFEKAQTFSIIRSPLQRQFGLASLTVDTAGASMMRYPLIRDLEAPVADALAERLLAEYRAARARSNGSPVEMIDAVDQRAPNPALHEEGDGDGSKYPADRAAIHGGNASPHPQGDTGAGEPEGSAQPPVPGEQQVLVSKLEAGIEPAEQSGTGSGGTADDDQSANDVERTPPPPGHDQGR
jgi:membrane protein YdbS with pleckstrin-like domain